jgi:flagellar assembly protein FliH
MSKMWERADFWPVEPGLPVETGDYARGLAEGRRTVEAELASERQALLQLVDGLEALEPMPAGVTASLIVAAVERLVSDIVGNAPIDAVLLNERAEALAGLMSAEAVLVVHPDDAPLLDGRPVAGDPALARGTVQLRSGDVLIEDGVASALERLRAELDSMGLAR